MKSLILFIWHLLTALITVARLGGVKALMAENNALRHQLAVMNRGCQRCPALSPTDRFVLGLCSLLWFSPKSWNKTAVILKSSTLLKFHKMLVKRKYQSFFTANKPPRKSGPKGPSQELIDAVVEMKRRNPRFGCPRISHLKNAPAFSMYPPSVEGSKSIWHLGLILIRMLFVGFFINITNPHQVIVAHLG